MGDFFDEGLIVIRWATNFGGWFDDFTLPVFVLLLQ